MGKNNMGAALVKFLQRAVPALKEQEIAALKVQKDIIEQNVTCLTSELAEKEILLQEIKLDTKRKLLLVGLGVGAVFAWLYVRNKSSEVAPEEVDLLDRSSEIAVPDTLECVICMEGMKEVMMEPCGHVCICRNCALTLRTNNRLRCPVCRASSDFRTVFIS